MSLKNKVMNLWRKRPIPTGRLQTGSGPGVNPEAMEHHFRGRTFYEIDLVKEGLDLECPLAYFRGEARVYYLGTYLVALLDEIENPGSKPCKRVDITGLCHAKNALREVLDAVPPHFSEEDLATLEEVYFEILSM